MTEREHRAAPAVDPGPSHGVKSEEDRISTWKIVSVGVASLLLFFFASLVTSLYFRVRLGEHPPLVLPPELGPSKIGLVEQQPFDRAQRGARDRSVREERLRSFGWVDRRNGIAHIPIERAMDLIAHGVTVGATSAGPRSDEAEPPARGGGQP